MFPTDNGRQDGSDNESTQSSTLDPLDPDWIPGSTDSWDPGSGDGEDLEEEGFLTTENGNTASGTDNQDGMGGQGQDQGEAVHIV